MVIKIHQVASTENAFLYNGKKVREGVATFFDSRNTLSANPFMYDEKHRLKNLLDIEKQNPRVKNKCFHVSVNPSAEDYLKLGDNIIRQEISNLMEHMGYGNQPWFVYKHKDLERVHFHIVSTRIDRETGRKIKDNSRKLFKVEIRKSGRGLIVMVTDDIGNPIRYPIRLSNFKEGPKFYKSVQIGKENQVNSQVLDKFHIAQWVRDLNRLVEKSKSNETYHKLSVKRKGKHRRL